MAQPSLAQDPAKAPRKDLALKGDAVCTRCHGVDDEYPVLAIGRTNDWTWSTWTFSDGTRMLQDPVQKVNFLGISYQYRWQ